MRRIPLGSTDVTITDYCLGTMTWGNQTPEDDAHRQMDMALAAGIDIVDTAEMYPVNPVRAETVGVTERILGTWNAKNPGRRGDYRLATKITGKNGAFVRVGQDITGATFARRWMRRLKRLQTDHIDIYQLHWPNRGSYHFRQNWGYDPSGQDKAATLANMREVLEAADAAQKVWKDRAFRPVERKRLGHGAVDPDRRGGRFAARAVDPERVFAALPALRHRPCRTCSEREGDASGLFAAGRRIADRQIPGRRRAGGQPAGSRPRPLRTRAPSAPSLQSTPISASRTATGSIPFTWRWPSRCSGPSRSPRSSAPPRPDSWRISSKGST
jgi:hypothetical protein